MNMKVLQKIINMEKITLAAPISTGRKWAE